MEKGLEQGRAEGKAEGIEEGKAQGIEEGEIKAKLETAVNFIKLGQTIEIASQATGLSKETIQAHLDQ